MTGRSTQLEPTALPTADAFVFAVTLVPFPVSSSIYSTSSVVFVDFLSAALTSDMTDIVDDGWTVDTWSVVEPRANHASVSGMNIETLIMEL